MSAKIEPRLVTIGKVAAAARAGLIAVRTLITAKLLVPVRRDDRGVQLFRESDYRRVRLLLDLLDAGVTLHELRQMDVAAQSGDGATAAAGRLIDLLDRSVVRVTEQLDRLRRLREDLISSRETLYRCHQCVSRLEELPCASCSAMPQPAPLALEVFFLPKSRKPR